MVTEAPPAAGAAHPDTEIGGGDDARAVVSLSALLSGVAILVLGNGLQGTSGPGTKAWPPRPSGSSCPLTSSAMGPLASSCLLWSSGSATSRLSRRWPRSPRRSRSPTRSSSPPAPGSCSASLRGPCYAGLIMVIESWLKASTGRQHRGRVLATYSVVLYAAWALSQPLLSVAPPSGFIRFCIVSICLSLALVPITLMGCRRPRVRHGLADRPATPVPDLPGWSRWGARGRVGHRRAPGNGPDFRPEERATSLRTQPGRQSRLAGQTPWCAGADLHFIADRPCLQMIAEPGTCTAARIPA